MMQYYNSLTSALHGGSTDGVFLDARDVGEKWLARRRLLSRRCFKTLTTARQHSSVLGYNYTEKYRRPAL